jgi:biopolymer transport protein TolR
MAHALQRVRPATPVRRIVAERLPAWLTTLAARARLMSQINVVPYIDVMLVLLVIFMVTAPLITTTVIDLPSVSRSNAPPAVPIEIIIKTKDNILVRDRERNQAEKRVSQDELIKLLEEPAEGQERRRAGRDRRRQDGRYGDVVDVMDLLQRNQIRKVGLLAKPAANQ